MRKHNESVQKCPIFSPSVRRCVPSSGKCSISRCSLQILYENLHDEKESTQKKKAGSCFFVLVLLVLNVLTLGALKGPPPMERSARLAPASVWPAPANHDTKAR